MSGLVVVGVDGSESGLGAVEVAAHEARIRSAELRVVHAFIWPLMHVPLGPSPLGPPEGGLRNMAEQLVAAAVERARETAPEVGVSRAVVTGDPRTVLEAESRSAELVVIGSRGMGGFVGLLVGSTAVHLAGHGLCPVLVVRERSEGPIVLGTDGSAAGERAVEFAFAEAALRDAPLVALRVWNTRAERDHERPKGPLADALLEPDGIGEAEHRQLGETVASWQERYPQVVVEQRLVRSPVRPALIDASRESQLVVVGARGRGGFAGLLLGSVSQALLHHGHCPVAIVPDRE